ncbi:MAG: ExeM/NucH family extracellular endonuclease [Ardenticatenaceae bacterium]
MRSHTLARRWIAPLMAVVTMLALVLLLASVSFLSPTEAHAEATVGASISINEVRIDQPSSDDDEYFELAGTPGTSLDSLSYLVIGDDSDGSSGVIEAIVPLSGTMMPASGYFVAAEGTFSLGMANLTTTLNFENSDNVTHLLVNNFTGSDQDDLDTDDDGVLDVMPWSEMLDCVALVETVGSGEQIYCTTTVGPDGTFVPGHSFSCPEGWQIGAFSPTDGDDTPGAANFCGVVDILSVQKNGPAGAEAGERITYMIDVNNVSTINADDVRITDTLPAEATFVSYNSSIPLTFTNNAPLLVWEAGTMISNTVLTISLSVDLSPTLSGSITNTVEATTSTPGDDVANNQDMVVTEAVGSGGPDANAPSLLLTEVKAQPTAGEFIEIYNPTTDTIDLSDVYLTDATFGGGSTYYYNIVTGSNAGGGGFGDFHARFPAGATIPGGAYQTIALNGSANFVTEYNMPPTYELYDDGTNDGAQQMLEALPGSINGQGGLSNDGEVAVLYYWNGSSDLVTDLDYALWGDRNEAVDKTGMATDGPDADSTSTAYLDDTATDFQDVLSGGAHAAENSWQREDMTEGAEAMNGGNGVGGDNETSEDVSNTWCEELPSPGEISPCAGPDLLRIQKNGPAEANASETITYTIDVENVGDVSAENVMIIDTLPDQVSFVGYTSSTPLTFTNNAQSLEWQAGTMPNDSALTISLTVLIDADFSAPLVNTVVVTSTTSGDDLDNNSDQAVTSLPIGGACGDPFTAIYAIQGDGANTPLPDDTLVTTEGVVVGDFQNSDQLNGFFLQDATGDGNAATSDGIFVFAPDSTDVAEGDVVRLTAQVSEFFDLTQLSNVSNMLNCGTGSATPATLTLPVDDMADFEPYEGMLINIPQELHVTELWQLGRYGQVTLSEEARLPQPTNVITPGLDANLLQEANNKRRIILDDGSTRQNPDPIIHPSPELSATNTLRGGDMLSSLTGILHYRADEYRVEPIDVVNFTHANERPPMPQDVGGTLKVASFNVLNYFNGDGMGGGFPTSRGADTPTEFTRQRDKIIAAILSLDADVIGLMEIENDGYGAHSAIQDLVNGLNAAAPVSPTYAFIDAGVPQIGTDQIAVGLIYNLNTVTPMGSATILDSTVDPLFNDDKNRPVLAQTFEENTSGEKVTVAVNHLKSKGSSCDDLGDPNTGDGQGNCNQTRTNAATALANWLATDPTGSADPDFLIIGDLNAYGMEDPITALKNAGYSNLLEQFQGTTAYTYVFDGQWGTLDYGLSNASLTPQVTGAAAWHINADEPQALDYNEEFQSPEQVISLYNDDLYRASDHDPVLIGLNLMPAPTYGVDLSPDQAQSGAINDSIMYTLTVTNTGSTTDTFMLSATGTWTTTVSPNSVTIGAGASQELQAQVDIPASASANESQTSVITATSSADSTVTDSATLTTTADDGDGVADDIEDGVPNPDGNGTGDGNGDGTPDSDQENVASLPNQGTANNQGYVTLESPTGTQLIDVMTMPAPAQMPQGVEQMPQGVFDFSISGLTTQSVMVTLTLHAGDTVLDTYYKQNQDGSWYEFVYTDTTGAIIATDAFSHTTITLHFVDGERGDTNPTTGVIHDPGAPGTRSADPTSVQLANLGTLEGTSHGNWPLALLATLSLAAGVAFWRRRRE